MQSKIGTVRNPLTVIAIFAGIAEISGTAVLPHIAPQNQELYIWFLMSFPFTLIIIFFVTLNWNHKVLYAPSDFKDEDNFVNILQSATIKEKIVKFEEEVKNEELSEIKEEVVIPITPNSHEYKDPQAGSITNSSLEDLKTLVNELSIITTKEEREKRSEILRKVHRQTRDEARLAEKLVLEKLKQDLNTEIETDLKLQFGQNQYVLDGVARKGNNLTAIEIKYLRDMRMVGDSMFYRSIDQLNSLFHSLTIEQKQGFSLIFVVVTDNPNDRQIEYVKRHLEKLSFPVALQVYELDALVKELMPDAS